MAKLKKVAKKIDPNAASERLRKALTKLRKVQLIELLVELARDDAAVMGQLESRVELEDPPFDELLITTQIAIESATHFDPRDVNHNFDYDGLAYDTTRRNFEKLIDLGGLENVMELAVELMRLGSCQVSVSDEGLMSDDIESCLKVVFAAVCKSKLDRQRIRDWCETLQKADETGLICSKEIKTLGK